METPLEAFAEFLSKMKLKMTPQRRLILDTICNAEAHLSPEELYSEVKERDSSIGQATVYRTLKLLTEANLVESLDFADGVARYECCHGEEHHDHLICQQCNKNIEIIDPIIEKRQEEIAQELGFKLLHHKMYLYGVCEDCRKKTDD